MSSTNPIRNDIAGVSQGAPGTSLEAAVGQDRVDAINADFYGKIQYPWPPVYYERWSRVDLWSKMIGQDIGSWDAPVVPEGGRIWVAGCGRNQAVITALRFPKAQVIASDVSEPSLAASREAAVRLGVDNLELQCMSLNHASYAAEFDYVICTGVIIVNADPAVPLRRLAKALKRSGVLELMVYNEYHRIATTAFQKAIRTFLGNWTAPRYDDELSLAERFVAVASRTTPKDWGVDHCGACGLSAMLGFLSSYKKASGGQLADALIQPVEHSYNIRSTHALTTSCDLEMLHFCVDQFSRLDGRLTWNMRFPDEEIQRAYDRLEDIDRWQITNLLTMQDSPMNWFYCQRRDADRPRRSERQLASDFLGRRFMRVNTTCELIPAKPGPATSPPMTLSFPRGRPTSELCKKVLDALKEHETIEAAFRRAGVDASFSSVHDVRVQLATSAFPFLEVVGA